MMLTRRLRSKSRLSGFDLSGLPVIGRLSPPLRWALLGSTAATLAVLLLPEPAQETMPVGAVISANGSLGAAPAGAASAPLGAIWQAYATRTPPEFVEAERDPFVPELPPAPPAPPPAAVLAAPAPPPPPPLPTTQFRVVGWLGVEGQGRQVLLTNGQTEVVAQVGLVLPDGFVVQSIDTQRLVLRHPSTQTDYALSLPASLAESQ